MTLKKITLAECHKELLHIATAFDQICQKHHIPYYMLGGTMLGAIRHNGFIPWDDDMDFGIPRPYFAQFITLAEQELPPKYKLITSKNSPALKKGFIKRKISSEDKRYKEIYLTPKSKKVKEIVFEDINKNNEIMFHNMSSKEKETLVLLVEKLLSNIQNKDIDF